MKVNVDEITAIDKLVASIFEKHRNEIIDRTLKTFTIFLKECSQIGTSFLSETELKDETVNFLNLPVSKSKEDIKDMIQWLSNLKESEKKFIVILICLVMINTTYVSYQTLFKNHGLQIAEDSLNEEEKELLEKMEKKSCPTTH